MPAPKDALLLLECRDEGLGAAYLRMVQAYYALRQTVGLAGQGPLKTDILAFTASTRAACGLPPSDPDPNHDQSGTPVPPGAAACVAASYDRQRDTWLAKLTGPAAEEAAREPRRNLVLQAKLHDLGLLPPHDIADDVFGTATRAAITKWQASAGRPQTAFIGDGDAALLAGVPWKVPAQKEAGPVEVKLLAPAEGFDGKPITLTYGDMAVRLDLEAADDIRECDPTQNSPLGLSGSFSNEKSCKVVEARLSVAGKEVAKTVLVPVADSDDLGQFDIKAEIIRLDPSARDPQVLFSGYTGGAHCCTTGLAATEVDGNWTFVSLGSHDGETTLRFLDVVGDGQAALVSADGSFGYKFASYAGSYAPTNISRLVGGAMKDVTREPRYRGFLLRELARMEANRASGSKDEVNGYLAGWVAQSALIGQFPHAWKTMLATYDHNLGLRHCAVDEHVLASMTGDASGCPAGRSIDVPFPEALAVFLNARGYLDKAQAAAVGYDVDSIAAMRAAQIKAATEEWKRHAENDWFILDNSERCDAAVRPSSPAELLSGDRSEGLEDNVSILSADASGNAVVARVDEPQAGGLVRTRTFYRGLPRCEDAVRNRLAELRKLR